MPVLRGRCQAPIVCAIAIAVAVIGVVACSDNQVATTEETGSTLVAPPVVQLPFGLVVVEGSEPLGRPLTYRDVELYYRNEPVESDILDAAFRVTGSPQEVLQAWVDQLASVGLGDVQVVTDGLTGRSPWASVMASGFSSMLNAIPPTAVDPAEGVDGLPGPGPGDAEVSLWATSEDPVLLVSVRRHIGQPALPASSPPLVGPLSSRPSIVVPWELGSAGEELFTEQGDRIDVPDGAKRLIPTLPTWGGTGGSTTVLSVDDADVAARAMLDQALSYGKGGEAEGPEITTFEGVRTTTGSFVIGAGGWGFDVAAVRGPDDPSATVWVRSSAD